MCTKNLETTLLFVDFSKTFDSIHEVYCLLEETVTAILMLHKNIKVMVDLLSGDTDFFDIVSGVLRKKTLILYLFIICLYYVL